MLPIFKCMVLTEPPSSPKVSSVGRSATVAWTSLPDLSLLPEMETKSQGQRLLDVERVESC
ncbi:hypothetical protein K443DRAFT_486054 [Laccaria amethystina LaAM-08-1]|uniref:Uncharacterized protein n=1 Tax=Laccaria amethystina LaAM-08-1 TaxID=1095629 RepID=A0A0C9WT94_9AGAR|nr:hypothetical protein K443DRAFT_486054 [Laccaria amethystina LaAM-08-1]